MTPIRISERKKIFCALAPSLKKKIPTKTLPTAPIPVQTGYAIPIGMVFIEKARSHILMINVMMKRTVGIVSEKPFEFFKKMAQITSKTPAMIKAIQLMRDWLMLHLVYLICCQGFYCRYFFYY